MNLTNHFIIAMPGLEDPIFERSVSIICQHTDQGAMGLTINRPTDLQLSDLLEQLNIPIEDQLVKEIPVYLGGPVETGHGFVLHSSDSSKDWSQTFKINNDISLSSSKDILQAIARGEGPEHYLVTLGYAGWSSGQIENEMKENSWLNVPADTQILFQTPYDKRWESAAMKLGIDIHLISNEIGHA